MLVIGRRVTTLAFGNIHTDKIGHHHPLHQLSSCQATRLHDDPIHGAAARGAQPDQVAVTVVVVAQDGS